MVTRAISRLPNIPTLRRLTRTLATLDAVLSRNWEYRYYSFNAHWAPGEMMASMRNGSGDLWFALFSPVGVVLHGLAHEAPNFRAGSPWPGIFDALPHEFQTNFLDEPAFDTHNSTFCTWRRMTDDQWMCGPVQLPPGDDPDGSLELLSMLRGEPQQYVDFARNYFERDLAGADVAAVYRHEPLTGNLVRRLNPDADLESLATDLDEIGYPE
jgi:hypothetical protein